jgi:xanthine dehydrogenase YagT iron-sulfur-binding subunit
MPREFGGGGESGGGGVSDTEVPEGEALRPTRREFLASATVAGVAAAAAPIFKPVAVDSPSHDALQGPAVEPVAVILNVNGQSHTLRIEPRVTLLDALREGLGLTGTKKGCDMGQCGACTVLVEGRRINSCLTLAVMQQGRAITTIEGLARGNELHPLQAAIVEHDGLQCGYCTPGQILSAVALLDESCGPSDADVREAMSGNLCRCGAYPNLLAAIQQVRGQRTT